MPMTYEEWDAANKAAGGYGGRYGYEQHMKSIGQPVQEDAGRQARVDFARKNIDSTISEEDWKRNDYAYDPNCPPNYPYRSDDGKGCAEKPQNSTQVMQDAKGNWGPAPKTGGRGRGGGRGGGRGANPGGQGGGDLALYQLKQQYADALNDPTGKKAWQLFAGQGGAQGFQDTMDARRAEIEGMPAGPARDRALSQLSQYNTASRVALPQQARANAIQGLSGIVQPELGYVGAERDRALQGKLGFANIGLQRELGLGNLALQGELGRGQLGLQRGAQNFEQGRYFDWQQSEADKNRQNALDLQNLQNKGNKKSGWETAGGIIGSIISDVRLKENIAPGRRGLTDLKKLGVYSYNFKSLPKHKRLGIMAQDLEKVAPEMVVDLDGVKAIDGYGLLSMTMQAIKDLDEKYSEKGGR